MSFKQTLTNLFGHNAVKKALIWVLVVAVAVIVVVTQFAFPVKAQYAYHTAVPATADRALTI